MAKLIKIEKGAYRYDFLIISQSTHSYIHNHTRIVKYKKWVVSSEKMLRYSVDDFAYFDTRKQAIEYCNYIISKNK